MGSAPSLAQIQDVFEALGPPGTPFTTSEVATRFDCTDRTIYNRLETLVEDGVLETKKVGARGRVWWQPVEEHKETDEKYRSVFESIEKGVCIIEVLFDDADQPADYRFLETNPAFDELTDLRDPEGKRICELEPDYEDHWLEEYGAVAQTGEPVQFTEYAEHLGERWYAINAFRIGDPTDHTVAILFEDISERKHIDNAVQESDQRLEALAEATTEGIYRISPDWSEIYQLAGEGFVSEDLSNAWQEYIPEDEQERVGQAIDEAIETQSPFELEHRIKRADGTVGWTHSRAVPILEDGEIVEWFGTATDITERKEREQAQKRAEKRYQMLLELAPLPIAAVDPATEEIIETNDAAGELIGCPTAELIGRTRASLHPTEKSDGYDAIFRKATERGGTWRHLPDGSPTQIVTEHGEKIPVEITGKKIELEGEDIVYGVLRDISDQLEYQHRLDTLNEVTHELFEAETEREVTRTAVEVLAEVLDVSTVAFYSFDEDKWELRPAVHITSSEEAEEIDELPVFEPGVGVESRAFTDGQTTIVDDFQTRETEYGFDRTIRSELAVPIGDRGVLAGGDTRPDTFDDWTANLVETLGATTEAALDYTEREQELRKQRQELREIESLNQQIRDISHTIVQADTREELEQSLCERLIASDAIEFAWIGTVDLEEQEVIPQTQAGAGSNYLDSVSLTLDGIKDPEPSVEAVQSRDACGSSNIATDIQHGDWRSKAIEREFRSVLSVPLIYREALYGALTVYSRATSGFSDALRSVLQELCDLTAHASAAIEQKEALHTKQTSELEFETRDEAALFCRLAAVLDCEIELERIVSQKGESTLAFFSVANGTPEEGLKQAKQLDGIEEGRLIARQNETFIQLRIIEPCIGSVLSNRGVILQQLVADSTRCRLTVEVPEAFNIRQAVNIVTSHYENTQLLAKRESDTSFNSRGISLNTAMDALTPRQREVVETAYRSGYFDSPRGASGKELAEMFDVSNSTFHEHIRKAEQTLFENLIEDTNSSLVT